MRDLAEPLWLICWLPSPAMLLAPPVAELWLLPCYSYAACMGFYYGTMVAWLGLIWEIIE